VVHAKLAMYVHADYGYLGLYPRGSLLPIQRKLGVLNHVEKKYILYVKRATSRRGLENEKELVVIAKAIWEKTKYEFKEFHVKSPESDLEIFRGSRVVFGCHGGALANIVFTQPGTHILELNEMHREKSKLDRMMYWGLANAAGANYWNIEPHVYDHDKPLSIDKDEFKSVMLEIKKQVLGHY